MPLTDPSAGSQVTCSQFIVNKFHSCDRE